MGIWIHDLLNTYLMFHNATTTATTSSTTITCSAYLVFSIYSTLNQVPKREALGITELGFYRPDAMYVTQPAVSKQLQTNCECRCFLSCCLQTCYCFMQVTKKSHSNSAMVNMFLSFCWSCLFRPRMTEIAFVLKAVATLVSTLKKTPSANGKFMWISVPSFHASYEYDIYWDS